MQEIRLTERLQRVLTLAEKEIREESILYPIHLLIASLKEKTSILGELRLKLPMEICDLKNISTQMECSEKGNNHRYFKCKVSNEVLNVIIKAESIMDKYSQVYLNEGHIIESIFSLDNEVNKLLSGEVKELILEITTTGRDLAVCLEEYKEKELNCTSNIVRRAEVTDREALYNFIVREFNEQWANNVINGLDIEKPSVFIATKGNEILGFGAYDVVRGKKGLFGPMGIKKECRVKNIGYSILHNCLRDMKEIGYEYIIIDDAGPIEFYEKSCGAVLIYNKWILS